MDYISVYPPAHNDTYVKATTKNSTSYWPYYATNPANSLIGNSVSNEWWCEQGVVVNQRFHIDLGSAKTVTRLYYENSHTSGGYTDVGVQNFILQGSNEAASFAELTYATDTGWTTLTVTSNVFTEHVEADQADPQYIVVTSPGSYRYYAIKATNNWGDVGRLGLRRIELQTNVVTFILQIMMF